MAYVTALNLRKRLALLSDGRFVPITTLHDVRGEDTNDIDRAVGFSAGTESEWFSGPIADMGANALT